MKRAPRWLRTGMMVGVAVVSVAGCSNPTDPDAPSSGLGTYEFPKLEDGDYVVQFAFQPDGTLWVATLNETLIRVAGGVTTYRAESELGGGKATDLFRAADGRLWIAFEEAYGVLDGTEWVRWDAPALKTPGTAIREIAVNASGEVLLGAGHADAGGLLLLQEGTWRALTPDDSPLPNSITNEIEVAADGDFWVGHGISVGGRGGLSRISGGEVAQVFTTDSGLLYNGIDALEAVGDRLYIGYAAFLFNVLTAQGAFPDGGLQILSTSDGSLDSLFPFETGLTSNRVRSMVFSDGYLWFGTGLDEARPGCETCFSGLGRLAPDGTLEVQSTLTGADLPPNAFLPWMDTRPDGAVYVIVEGVRIEPVVLPVVL